MRCDTCNNNTFHEVIKTYEFSLVQCTKCKRVMKEEKIGVGEQESIKESVGEGGEIPVPKPPEKVKCTYCDEDAIHVCKCGDPLCLLHGCRKGHNKVYKIKKEL